MISFRGSVVLYSRLQDEIWPARSKRCFRDAKSGLVIFDEDQERLRTGILKPEQEMGDVPFETDPTETTCRHYRPLRA